MSDSVGQFSDQFELCWTVRSASPLGETLLRLKSVCTVVHVTRDLTSSSAVAERPRDALCPSVVSLNKIITRANSFIIFT